jgi:hypothetical protein
MDPAERELKTLAQGRKRSLGALPFEIPLTVVAGTLWYFARETWAVVAFIVTAGITAADAWNVVYANRKLSETKRAE